MDSMYKYNSYSEEQVYLHTRLILNELDHLMITLAN